MSTSPVAARVVALPGHAVDLARHALLDGSGARVELRPQALDVLCALARQAGETVDKRQLMDQVWPGMVVTDDSLVQAISDLRRAIGDERHEVIQTVPRRGYRLIAALPPAAPQPDASDAALGETAGTDNWPDPMPPSTSPARATQAPRWRTAQGAAWILAGVLLAGVVAAWQPWRPGATATPAAVSPDRPPIAVLDFADAAAAPEDQQMARAWAEELTGELARNADLSVIAAQSSFAAGARGDGLPKVAERLGVGYLVAGSLRREGEQLRLLVQLVDGHDGRVVWTERHDLAAPQVYTVRDALVQRIATSLHSTMRGNQETAAVQRPPASLDSYAMTMRAITLKHRYTPPAFTEARALLEQVVAQDPLYAPGWLYLGYVNGLDWMLSITGPRRAPMLEQGIGQIEHSLTLDPRLAAAHGGLAVLYPRAGRHEDAVRAGRRCVELAPSDAECMVFLSVALVFAGDPGPALPLARRALALNPLPPPHVLASHGAVMWANGHLDEALASLDACLQAAPKFAACRLTRAIARTEAGRVDEAAADLAAVQAQLGAKQPLAVVATADYGPRAGALAARRRAAIQLVEGRQPLAAKP